MNPPSCDAHNHLQDHRFAPLLESVIAELQEAGVERCVVNGTCEGDWPRVAALARAHPDLVVPSFGLHPWLAAGRSPAWLETLGALLDRFPGAGIGECGLDRWMRGYDLNDQLGVFLSQLSLAAERERPISIHCLQAWGPLLECLGNHPRPKRGFLLHSYGGSAELVPQLAKLGAWFSFSGHFLHPRKAKTREAFRHVPADRLLVETDAPDMALPKGARSYKLKDPAGAPLNHPGNLPAVIAGLATVLDTEPGELRARTVANFNTFFGS